METQRCENCQAPLTDAYCAACGQSRRSSIVSVRAFASQVLDDVASLDSKLVRSLRALFLQPGHLTREYLDGRRVRHTQPVQLYLIAAATFFLMSSYRPFVWIDTDRLQVVGELPAIAVRNEVVRQRLLELAANPIALELFAERFVAAVNGFLPVFLIVSVVLFSLVLYAANHRRDSRYLPHAIFALHWTAFYLLVIALARLFPNAWKIQNSALFPALIYLTLALRRVYAQGVGVSLAKALLLLLAFLAILASWVQSALVIGMMAL